MKLKDILKNSEILSSVGDINLDITEISQDSRSIQGPRSLYVAVRGTQVDGHDFIHEAIQKGACAVICENFPEDINANVCYVQVKNCQKNIGKLAANFYENPSEKLKVIATTGTNGKTTVATLLHQSLGFLGEKAALFSTAGDYLGKKKLETKKQAASSMEPIEFQRNLALAAKEGCSYVCIEATSHALDQYRLAGTKITAGIFTNLTQDHLNYHGTMEYYGRAKRKLFSEILDKNSFAVVNIDDSYGAFMIEQTKAQIVSYGNKRQENPIHRDYYFDIKDFGMQGTSIEINGILMQVPLIGVFNMYNITAVFAVLHELGFNKQEVSKSFLRLMGTSGRMEIVVGKKKGLIGIVDYAHTPDALENVLKTLQEVPHKRIITVVGVGGGRDRAKRPLMGEIAVRLSDYVFFTSDNPRYDDPNEILGDIFSGIPDSYSNYEKNLQRACAIEDAVKSANSGDIILVAGKGHETYQEVMGVKEHFSDQEELKKHFT